MWRTCLGHRIYTSSSGAQVFQNIKYRWLTFGTKPIQTLIDRHHPERPMLEYIPALIQGTMLKPGRGCLLGLGGAGLAHALKSSPLHAIEINPEIIDICERFFMRDRLSHMTIEQQDASEFIASTPRTFDHLFIDLFDAHIFPAACHTPTFFSNCHRILQPDGLLAINLANPEDQWPVFQSIRTHFSPQTLVISFKKLMNIVIISPLNPKTSVINVLPPQKMAWDPKWGWVSER